MAFGEAFCGAGLSQHFLQKESPETATSLQRCTAAFMVPNWVGTSLILPAVFLLLRSCSMPFEIPSTKSWKLTIALRCTTSWVSQGPKMKRLKRHPRQPWLAVKALGSNEAGGRFQRVSWSLAKFATGKGKTQRMVDWCWPVDSQNSSGSFQEGFPATILGATSSTSTTFAVFGSKLHHSSNGGEEVVTVSVILPPLRGASNPASRHRWSQWSTGSPCRIVGRSSQVEDCCA